MTETNADKDLGDAATSLILQVMQHSHAESTHIINQLYNAERRRRLALEAWLHDFQLSLDDAHGGTYREMDRVLRTYAYPPTGYSEENEWARKHRDWREDL